MKDQNVMNNQAVKIHDLEFELYISKEDIQQRVLELGTEIGRVYKDKNPIFIAILNGSYIFAADLTRACNIDCEISFTKLSSYAGTASTGEISTLIGLGADIKGRDVIIVEDIIDTGKTLSEFLKVLEKMEPSSIGMVSLLVKPDAIEHTFPIDFIGFNIPNKFVVGYGLDYNEGGRQLDAIYQLRDQS